MKKEEIKYKQIPLGRAKDLSNKKFNKLKPLYRVENYNGRTPWLCVCDCGEYTIVDAGKLTKGSTTSCGCVQKQTRILNGKNTGGKNRENLVGKYFGFLKVLRNTGKTVNGSILWECECTHCHNIVIIPARNLKSGNTKSCGKCIKSTGEQKIYDILTQANIMFETQKVFNDCKDVRPLPFDFYLPKYNILIEFDGKQHFEPVCFGGIDLCKAKENLKLTQKHDKYKNQYAKEHGYKLIRIPYTKYNSLTIDDLLVEA